MDARALKEYVSDHPKGVLIRMIDGREFRVPHRDVIWFTPAFGQPESRVGRYSTAFHVADEGVGRLLNALLVAEVTPLKPHGNGHGGKGKKGKPKRG
jgi:hypothetical protein